MSNKKEVVIAAILAFLVDMSVTGAILVLLPHNLVHYALVFMVAFYFVALYFALKWMRFDKDCL